MANYLDDGSGVYGYTNIELLASGSPDFVNSFPRPAPEWTHSSYPVGYTSRAVNHWAADGIKLTGFGAGDLNLTFNGANDNEFAAIVISSTSANLLPGSNTVSEITLDSAWYGSTTVPTTGTLALLLVPASLSQAGEHGYVYSARLGGAMSSYLPLVMRPVATPTPPPTPKPGPRPGHWDDGEGGDFYVTTDSQYVRDFGILVFVPGCGTYHIWRGVDVPITNNQFSFTGSFSGSGTFTSVTTANIVSALNAFFISGCGFVSGGPWPSTATWQDYSQPDIGHAGTDLFQVAPAGTPEPGAAVKVRQATVD